MNSRKIYLLIGLLQMFGVVSAFAVAELLNPNFEAKYKKQYQWEVEHEAFYHVGSRRMLEQHFYLHIGGYFPFLLGSLAILYQYVDELFCYLQKIKKRVAISVAVASLILFTGLIYEWLIPEANPKWSFAVIGFLYGIGLFGMVCMYSAKDRKEPWVLFALGATMLMMAYVLLELLLLTGFGL